MYSSHADQVTQMMGNNGKCGYDGWFAYEYWSDSPDCQIPVWVRFAALLHYLYSSLMHL